MSKLNLSRFNKGVFLVNLLGIVYDQKNKKILIGRRENDPYLKDLTWSFPGGRPGYQDDLEECLKQQIKLKTGLEVTVEKIIFAKTYPEQRQFFAVYYFCRPLGGAEKSGEKFIEIQWVSPAKVKDYFTTSLHPALEAYLESLA